MTKLSLTDLEKKADHDVDRFDFIVSIKPRHLKTLCECLRMAMEGLDLIASHATSSIISTEEESDMSANWVERRSLSYLSKIKERISE